MFSPTPHKDVAVTAKPILGGKMRKVAI